MADINTTLVPLIGPIETLYNTVKVLVGGVFGLTLIILYLRWREYFLVKKMFKEIRGDLRAIADKQKIILPSQKTKNLKKK